jgi:HAD superfamily hydrolase (TIGR01490 family)
LNRACFFDLDRTFVRVNTARLYARWQYREGMARRRDLAKVTWWVLRYTVGGLDAEAVARRLVRGMAGRDEADFARRVDAWVEAEVLPQVAPEAVDELARRKADGYVCALLTATSSYAADSLARRVGIEHVLASRFAVDGGRFTGEIVEPFCYGEGKVRAVGAWARDRDIDLGASAFFTDSASDLPMLERVGEPVAVNPDPRLRWQARRRGWPVRWW